MHTHHRAYDDLQRDFERIWKFLIQDCALRKDKFVWLTSRFGDWKYGLWIPAKFFPNFMPKNAHLWLSPFEDVLGFVISEGCDHNFALFTRVGHDYLADEMLTWVMDNWNDRGQALRTEVHEFQDRYMEVLARHGFRNQGQVAVTRQYDLTTDIQRDVVLADGYRIVDMVENHDYASKRRVQVNAFRNQGAVTEIDLLAYEYSRECPSYNPAFDLSVIDEAGVHASACLGFVDYENRISEIERVCTHSAYRRRRLGEAVIRECMLRLKTAGFETAYITGYSAEANALYEKLGPVGKKDWLIFEMATQRSRLS